MAADRHKTFWKVGSPCHLKLEGSQRPGSCRPPSQQMMIRREARAKHLPALVVWFNMIWIAEAKKKGTQLEKNNTRLNLSPIEIPFQISIMWQNA